jgi:hypothetical protein
VSVLVSILLQSLCFWKIVAGSQSALLQHGRLRTLRNTKCVLTAKKFKPMSTLSVIVANATNYKKKLSNADTL